MSDEATMLLGGPRLAVKDAAIDIRLKFVRKVYFILATQLLLTVCIATPIYLAGEAWVASNQWLMVLSMVVYMVVMISMCCCQKAMRSYPANYIFLGLVTACLSVIVGYTSSMYSWQSVMLCAGISAAIFIGMTIYAWTTTTDFTGLGPYLFAAVLCMMVFGFTIFILGLCGIEIDWLIMVYDFCGVLLFTFFIVFDTQKIMGELGGHKVTFSIDDYAFAALNLYIDIIQLFIPLVRLLGSRR